MQLVELKNGETYNGHLVSCDNWMNINLREVICTSRVRLEPLVPGTGRGFSSSMSRGALGEHPWDSSEAVTAVDG